MGIGSSFSKGRHITDQKRYGDENDEPVDAGLEDLSHIHPPFDFIKRKFESMYYNANNMARVGNAVMKSSNFLLKNPDLDYKLMEQ